MGNGLKRKRQRKCKRTGNRFVLTYGTHWESRGAPARCGLCGRDPSQAAASRCLVGGRCPVRGDEDWQRQRTEAQAELHGGRLA